MQSVVITHPFFTLNGGLIKPPLKLRGMDERWHLTWNHSYDYLAKPYSELISDSKRGIV